MCNPSLYKKELEKKFKKAVSHCSIACSDILIEIMNEGVTKADAINHLCDYYSINKNRILSLGDKYNDKERC